MGDRDEAAEANTDWKFQDLARISGAPICPNQNCSNPSTLLALPLDLREQILLQLDGQDIRTCTLLSKEFNIFIRSSIVLQYLIACHAAGVVDNPYCKLSYAERYEALSKREEAWRMFLPVFTRKFDVPNELRFGIHKLNAGVYLLGDSNGRDLRYCTLPSTPDEVPQWATIHGHGPQKDWNGSIVNVGMAIYEHDLIVNVVSLTDSQDNHVVYSLNMVPLQFSTGKYHPLAQCPQIYVQDFGGRCPDTVLEIVGNNVALATRTRLFIFDWKTGRKKLQYETLNYAYSSLVFISPEILFVPNDAEAHLEVWKIPKEVDRVPYQSLHLRLPSLSEGQIILGITCCSAPNPYIHDMPYAPSRPFHTSADNAIIVISPRFSPSGRIFALFIHRRSLLDIIEKFSHVNTPSTQAPASGTPRDVVSIPWSEWGPPISRWLDTDETPPAGAVAPAGLRWAFIDSSFGVTDMRIYDFNPHNIYWRAQEYLQSRHIIARKGDNFAHCDGVFAEDVEMGLGCTVYMLPQWYDFHGVLMDEERLLCYNLSSWSSDGYVKEITVLYFG
ncbi:hypothetical protein F5887DRAFT_1111444 [Amanita rubescens]|nr:hypothetical protein F5887DRAFT_1111444 [Amanita rubescens]